MRSRWPMQVLFVVAAFAAMVGTCYFFGRGVERQRLNSQIESTFSYVESSLMSNLKEPETMLGVISETIRGMLKQGQPYETVKDYITEITEYGRSEDAKIIGFVSAFAMFDIFGGRGYNGLGWEGAPGYVPEDRAWYKAAVAANGKIAVTDPYVDVITNEVAISYSRAIFDDDGVKIATVCIDINLSRVYEFATGNQHDDIGYWMLLDRNLTVLAHPNAEFLGQPLRDVKSSIAGFYDELKRGETIAGRDIINYNGEKSVAFTRRISNGWFLGVTVPTERYYSNLNRMKWFLIALGLLLSAALSSILIRMALQKDRAEEQRLQLLKTAMEKQHEAEIAEESSATKSRFLAAMSHEIRTPMNVILGVTDIQLQDDTLPPHLREALSQVYNSGDLLLSIINDILDLSKIEAGRMEFTPSKYSLASLINDTAHLNMMRNSKPIEFELNIDENVPMHLYGDEIRIKQILNNLLSNAFKFTEAGAVKLSVNIENEKHEGTDNDTTLVIVVSDTGQGMSKEQVGRLFTEYTRFNLDVNRTVEGTGLGMSITRHLIDMMGGKITVVSDVGKGTTITVRLPQKRVGDKAIGKELAKNLRTFRIDTSVNLKRTQINREYMPYGRVLIVDDVESNLYVARGLMASYGLSIDTASSGQEAIDKVTAGKMYDIIFMDHMMPKMDGIEAVKRIRDAGYTLPIVALTANAVVGQADIFLKNGFNDFISKPIDIRQLNAILNRMIRDKQTPEMLERARQTKDRMSKSLPLLAHPAADPELLLIFARDAAKSLPVLESVAVDTAKVTDDDLLLFAINTHAMKSALANIGESRLAQVAHTLEKSGKSHDRKTIALQTPSFIKALRGLIEKAEAECKLKECAAADEDPKFLKEQLAVIAKACWDYDERAVGAALDALKKMTWTAETEDILAKIAELQLHSSFEEAAEVAALAAKRVRG